MNKVIKCRKASIIEDEYVEKESDKDIDVLFEHLKNRNYLNIPNIIDKTDNKYKYEYIRGKKEKTYVKEQEIIKLMASLHFKTSYQKDVSKNKYRSIYETIENNINFIEDYYEKTIESIELETYMSPSHYLIARNYSVILGSIEYAKKELKAWFKLVENKEKERVCVVHNNIKLEHLIMGDNSYLVNWDDYIVDTPILDIYKYMQNEGLNISLKESYNLYKEHNKLNPEEEKLLFIILSIPRKIEEVENEYINTKNIKYIFDYLYQVSSLINTKTNS